MSGTICALLFGPVGYGGYAIGLKTTSYIAGFGIGIFSQKKINNKYYSIYNEEELSSVYDKDDKHLRYLLDNKCSLELIFISLSDMLLNKKKDIGKLYDKLISNLIQDIDIENYFCVLDILICCVNNKYIINSSENENENDTVLNNTIEGKGLHNLRNNYLEINTETYIYIAIEKILLYDCYDHFFGILKTINIDKDSQIEKIISNINFENIENYSIFNNINECYKKLDSKIINKVENISICTNPFEKLTCLLNIQKDIANIYLLVNKEELTSDDALPLLCYVIVKSRISSIYSELDFLNKFYKYGVYSGVYDFSLIMFTSVIEIILNIS